MTNLIKRTHDGCSSQNPFFFFCLSVPLKLCGKACPLWCPKVSVCVEVYSISSRHQHLSVNTISEKNCLKTRSWNMITLNFTVTSTQIPGSSPSSWSYCYVWEVFIQSVLYFMFLSDLSVFLWLNSHYVRHGREVNALEVMCYLLLYLLWICQLQFCVYLLTSYVFELLGIVRAVISRSCCYNY